MDSCAIMRMRKSIRPPTSLTRSRYSLPRRSSPALRMVPKSVTLKKKAKTAATAFFGPCRPYSLRRFMPKRPKSEIEKKRLLSEFSSDSDDSDSDEYDDLLFAVNSPLKLSDSEEKEDDKEMIRTHLFSVKQMLKSIYQQFKGFTAADSKKSGGAKRLKSGTEIKEDAEAMYVRVDMPGLSKEDVKVGFARDNLIISGEGGEDGKKYREELFVCGEWFKVNEIKAEMKNGVLKVVIPRKRVEEREDYVMVSVE